MSEMMERIVARLSLIIGSLIYIMLLHYFYVNIISDVAEYMGYVYNPQSPGLVACAWLIAILPSLWMPIALERPSLCIYWILYLMVYVPASIIPWYWGQVDSRDFGGRHHRLAAHKTRAGSQSPLEGGACVAGACGRDWVSLENLLEAKEWGFVYHLSRTLKKVTTEKGGVGRSILTLVSGTAFAQGLHVISSPILTRLYSPQDFGLSAVFISAISLVGTLPTLRYEFAIVQSKEDSEASNLLVLCFALTALVTAGLWLLTILFGRYFAELLKISAQQDWLWIVAVGAGAAAAIQIFSYWYGRKKQFRWVANNRMLQAVVTSGYQLVAAFTGHAGFESLLVGYVLGQVATVAVCTARMFWEDGRSIATSFHPPLLLQQACVYHRYPVYGCVPSLLNNATLALPVIFFSTFYGPTVTGYFSLMSRVLNLPASLLGMAFSQVFLQRASEEKNRTGRIDQVVRYWLPRLGALSLLYLLVMITSPFFFVLVFGKAWWEAGIYALILAPSVTTVQFTASALSVLPGVVDKEHWMAAWKLGGFATTALFLGLATFLPGPRYAIACLSACIFVLYTSYLWLILKATRTRYFTGWRPGLLRAGLSR